MKKTISITINKMVFNIEEDAFETLNVYLEALKKHFGSSDEGQEVVNDIESRISEQFATKMRDRKAEVVGLVEVNEVIKAMGSVEDLTGGASKTENSAPAPEAPGRRRLYRNPDDQIIAGVASGIASYFNIDPLIPRVLLVVSAFIGGYGILLYLILWIIVPEAQTAADKLEMKGAAVNIANLQESLKDRPAKKNFSVIRYFFREVFYLFGRFLRMLGPIIMTIIGLIMTAVSFVALFAVSLLTLLLLFNPNSPYIDPAIAQVFNGSQYVLLVSSGFISIIIPTLVALIIGVSFIRRKNALHLATGTTLAILWLVGGLTFAYLATSTAPQIDAAVKSIQERPELSKEVQVGNFTSVTSSRDENVKITHGTQTKVIVYGREKELKNVNIYVKDDTLVIDHDDNFQICIICINRPITIEVMMPTLTKVSANNASKMEIRGFNTNDTLKINATSASRVEFDGSTKLLNVLVNNAAKVTLSGKSTNLEADVNNAGRLEAAELTAENVLVEAKNSGHASVHATKKIHAIASGASRIDYSGNPAETEFDESNAASIRAE